MFPQQQARDDPRSVQGAHDPPPPREEGSRARGEGGRGGKGGPDSQARACARREARALPRGEESRGGEESLRAGARSSRGAPPGGTQGLGERAAAWLELNARHTLKLRVSYSGCQLGRECRLKTCGAFNFI